MTESNLWRELSFDGRSAVVTGAARGIGRAVAYRLAGLGARTVIWDRDGDVVERTAGELREMLSSQGRPHQLEWAQVDVSDSTTVEESMARATVSGLDILVNSAAIMTIHQTEGMPLDLWNKAVGVNLSGVFYCCRAAIPYLRQHEGSAIVNISSSAAITGGNGGVHYAASKAGIDGLTRHLARELAPVVRVNSIMPRSIDSDGFRAALATHADPTAMREKIVRLIPMQRLGKPEDIADAVAFLASDWASFITGQILIIDGGRTYT
jgi:3-oxoacyl-[acyl-carrier protein] reductase